nr:RNA-binding protein 40-like [Onthophagus taurus]
MVCEDTLRIKHLPPELSHSEKEDLLRHFGAQKVKIVTTTAKHKSVAFAQFESKEIAKSVLIRLHQIKIFNSRLCVEFAENDIGPSKPRLKNVSENKNEKTNFKNFVNKLNSFNSFVSFNQPPPSHLRYAYPKPNRATINNIAHALASVPKFYTQVLHLMNRMNLPPPFSDIPDPPHASLRQPIQTKPPPPPLPPKHESSSESELESDPENNTIKEIIPEKRTLPQKKQVKRPKFIKPNPPNISQKQSEKVEDIFEKTQLHQRKIELKVSTINLEDIRKEQSTDTIDTNSNNDQAANVSENRENDVITEEELSSNQIPLKDLNVFPVFKDYHPGAATNRLYIKNIAKSVETKDLEYIYKRYVDYENNESNKEINIRLMQEGRMKGQAFVTLGSVQLAQLAVKETNGFLLKDKPLVVVFAKSVTQKK